MRRTCADAEDDITSSHLQSNKKITVVVQSYDKHMPRITALTLHSAATTQFPLENYNLLFTSINGI